MKTSDPRIAKKLIITRFRKHVKGKKPNTASSHKGHDGKEGHWLEVRMGIAHNASNTPDLYGFEMKNHTRSKTTFGDWSADYYIFHDEANDMSRDDFLKVFGMPNPLKKMRYSWSGKPCPTIHSYNACGQILEVDSEDNIVALYNFRKDSRTNKATIVPKALQRERLVLARWYASSLKRKLERKFNRHGWFQCKKDSNGVYATIVFGDPINFSHWIDGVRKGFVFFDSGMYQGNPRPYSQWRAHNKYWDSLITSTY